MAVSSSVNTQAYWFGLYSPLMSTFELYPNDAAATIKQISKNIIYYAVGFWMYV